MNLQGKRISRFTTTRAALTDTYLRSKQLFSKRERIPERFYHAPPGIGQPHLPFKLLVSFDIFDTLLGRYVLRPKDLFELMEQEGGSGEVPFAH